MKVILKELENKQSLYGKRGCGVADIIPVFGLLKRGSKVCICIVNNTIVNTLISVIKEKVVPDSIVYSDSYASYSKRI
ncbi:MAG: transposase [Treponemataceae bacterium]